MSAPTEHGIEDKQGRKIKPTPKELVYKYLVFLPLFIVSIGVCLAIAYIYLRYKVPLYNSSISVLIIDDKNSRGNTAALDEIAVFRTRVNLANEVEILKSATLMQKVVRALNLNTQFLVEGNLKTNRGVWLQTFHLPGNFKKGYYFSLRYCLQI